jgi:hypothetical protein
MSLEQLQRAFPPVAAGWSCDKVGSQFEFRSAALLRFWSYSRTLTFAVACRISTGKWLAEEYN